MTAYHQNLFFRPLCESAFDIREYHTRKSIPPQSSCSDLRENKTRLTSPMGNSWNKKHIIWRSAVFYRSEEIRSYMYMLSHEKHGLKPKTKQNVPEINECVLEISQPKSTWGPLVFSNFNKRNTLTKKPWPKNSVIVFNFKKTSLRGRMRIPSHNKFSYQNKLAMPPMGRRACLPYSNQGPSVKIESELDSWAKSWRSEELLKTNYNQ